MSWLQALLLGALQGATEFLPISSSGHLVLVPWLLGWEIEPAVSLPFAVIVHWGTVTAVIVSLRRELRSLLSAAVGALVRRRPLESPEARLAWLLALGSVPAALAGALFETQVEQVFGSPTTVAVFLWVTALLLLVGERLRGSQKRQLWQLSSTDALLIGGAQALALLPGISRSGATMATAVGRGFDRPAAARFSFLLGVPIMLGAGALSLAELFHQAGGQLVVAPLLVGFLSSLIVGMVAIQWLLAYLSRGSLRGFAVYCLAAGAAALALSVLRG